MATLPKQNISVMDVRNILGEPSTDVGTLCSSGKINIWSKYKPVNHNFTNTRPNDWWKGYEGTCGISYNRYNSVADVIAAVDSSNYGYTYLKPKGGATSPYRLGDFAGYNHTSTPPIIASNIEGTYYMNNTNFGASFIQKGSSIDELNVTDVFGATLESIYPAVAFKQTNNAASVKWITSTTAGANNTITIPLNAFTTNTSYYAYMFLSNVKKESFSMADKTGSFIIVPNTVRQTITIQTTSVKVSLINIKRSAGGVVSGTLHIDNETGSSINYTQASLQIRYSNKNYNDTFESGEVIITLDAFSVLGGTTKDIPFSRSALPDFSFRGGKVFAFLNNSVVAQTIIPMMSA